MRKGRGIYIHIPFCVKKCNYCAFLSYPADGAPRKEYTDALVNEIKLRAGIMRGQVTSERGASEEGRDADATAVDTIYVGGGTPSVLDISQMRDIMHAVKSSFNIKPDAEVTIEANPGTLGIKDGVTRAKLQAYKYMGFNRLSMGVQSMDNSRLDFLGRLHTAENVARDVRLARELGFDNINLDLIFSVPETSKEDTLEDLKAIIDIEPEHISCYSLQIEEGTPFCEMINRGEIEEVPDEADRETYHEVCRMLRNAGYEHYEISNFAKMSDGAGPGFGDSEDDRRKSPYRSRHNSLYWDMSDYTAFGLGASGFERGVRYRNISDLEEYISLYGKEEASGTGASKLLYDEKHENTPFDNMSEAVFTGLRRREGITYEEAASAYLRAPGADEDISRCGLKMPNTENIEDCRDFFWEIFKESKKEAEDFASQGLLIIDDRGLCLTERGIDISNQIMSLFV